MLKTFCIIVLAVAMSGCQTGKNYHDFLIEESLASEIPTLVGNLAGGIFTSPLLIFSLPIGYIAYSEEEEKERDNVILAPVRTGAYGGGILFGTPFAPFALAFPRERANTLPQDPPKENTTTKSSNDPK